MDFKFIDNANELYKQKHYLKNRNLSILEFQLRLVDLLYLNEIPFMERINFIKIICNNLEEFISVRLPNEDINKVPQMIHTIESIYKKLGKFLNYVNDINEVHLEDYTKSLYKIISDKSFRYIYAGESSIEIAEEIKDVIKIKNSIHTVDILYSNCNIHSSIFKNTDVKHFIKIPMCIMILDEYIEYYSKISSEVDYYPKENIEVETIDYFTHLQTKDMLIRNPYESYDYVINFIDQMCNHSEIVAVFITLYRTAKDSKIIKSLLTAKSKGKDVYVYIEPTARDNEEENLKNIELLNSAGIHVNCNYYNYKVHSKVFCAIGKNGKIFTHIGTGNYNETTAKLYTDFHLLTTNKSITLEAIKVMMSIFRKDIYKSSGNDLHLYSSPLNFRSTIIRLIKSEMKKGKNGKIKIKCNSICDCDVIDKLYQAASAGVKIQIICRTGCSVTLHENIEVRSKVGRYLEHDRFYIFGDNRVYISSADLLLRNINKRLEILCEILEDENKNKVIRTFEEIWNDKHIHILQENGKWRMS